MIHLPEKAQQLLESSMAWMDRLYDDNAALLWHPEGAGGNKPVNPQPQHMVRDSTWYALGLLMRDSLGDRQRAEQVLYMVLDHQLSDPEAPFHGTFLRAPEEARPGLWAREWRDYDPNWRDFIGCTFALILLHFENILPVDLTMRMESALRLAVEGTLARRVSPSYTNIALMDAYLLHYVGSRLGLAEWQAAGERLGEQVYALFQQHKAFEEYNSPTYYGVDLFALGLWRSFATSETLRQMGSEMEADMWQDIARFYHAGLRNIAGPWDRSYGMDMKRYAAVLGLWLWPVTGQPGAPFPRTDLPFEHSADFCFGPCVALTGAQIPESALPHFFAFQGSRSVEHTIASAPLRVASAWLDETVMLGGEFTSRSKQANYQFHPFTMHWHTQTTAGVGWCRLRHAQPVDVRVSEGQATMEGSGQMLFEVCTPGAKPEDFQPTVWRLAGLTVQIITGAPTFTIQPGDEGVWNIIYESQGEVKITVQIVN